jgi:hypothetical protein
LKKQNRQLQCIVPILNGKYNSAPDGTIGGRMIVEITGVHNYKETNEGRLGETFFGPHEERIELPKKPALQDFNVTGSSIKIVQ